jgi:tRNA-Thr(GGU) m(6)t(6)A37 methyltransferase TsaA
MVHKKRSSLRVEPIGIIRSPFTEAAGTPIQSAVAQGTEGWVDVFPDFVEGLADLAGFERIWLLYWFHKASSAQLTVKPYICGTERGLFATRAPCRPNRIGMSAVRLLRITGHRLQVADVDILDETPLLDIKPYVPKFDHFDVGRFGWIERATSQIQKADGRFYEKE